jgi:GMP synthase-like glutamine amidotransferase
MRLHLLEHDPIDLSRTNITRWAKNKGHQVVHTYLCNGEELPEIDDFDWLMVMGGFAHAWEEDVYPWLRAEKEFLAKVVDHDKMILGVCFGAQLLAETLGGNVFQNKHKEIGWYEVDLTSEGQKSFLFENVPHKFVTFHWHADHFSLPPGCTRLAYTEPSANQVYILDGRPLVGLQFHPEYTVELIRYFGREWSDGWQKGPFVAGKEAIMAQTESLPENYWLIATVLDNMEREFGANR